MNKREPIYESIICKCGHILGQHYRKNYLYDKGKDWGNVDHLGCEDCNKEGTKCSHFESVKVDAPYSELEQDLLVWSQSLKCSVPLLDQIEREEIKGKMRGYEWVHRNRERWVKILKEAGFSFERAEEGR